MVFSVTSGTLAGLLTSFGLRVRFGEWRRLGASMGGSVSCRSAMCGERDLGGQDACPSYLDHAFRASQQGGTADVGCT